jgi:hypothetical protein
MICLWLIAFVLVVGLGLFEVYVVGIRLVWFVGFLDLVSYIVQLDFFLKTGGCQKIS